jgi:DNA-binding XRE family transcriptional regulator
MTVKTNKLYDLRSKIGATQSQFADRMGVPLRTYEDLETERTTIRPVHVRAAEMAAILFAIDKGLEDKLPGDLQRIVGTKNQST